MELSHLFPASEMNIATAATDIMCAANSFAPAAPSPNIPAPTVPVMNSGPDVEQRKASFLQPSCVHAPEE